MSAPGQAVDNAGSQEPDVLDKQRLRDSLAHLYYCRALLGSLPQQPPTWRGRIGLALVKAVRRALFWLTPQLDAYYAASIEMTQQQLTELENLAHALEQLRMRQDRLEAAVASRDGESRERAREEAGRWMQSVESRARIAELECPAAELPSPPPRVTQPGAS